MGAKDNLFHGLMVLNPLRGLLIESIYPYSFHKLSSDVGLIGYTRGIAIEADDVRMIVLLQTSSLSTPRLIRDAREEDVTQVYSMTLECESRKSTSFNSSPGSLWVNWIDATKKPEPKECRIHGTLEYGNREDSMGFFADISLINEARSFHLRSSGLGTFAVFEEPHDHAL